MLLCSLLVSFLFAGTSLADSSCTLPKASNETFDVTTAHKQWFMQYRYAARELDPLGCLNVAQDPGATATQMTLTGNFSKQPQYPVTADISFEGNVLHSIVHGRFGDWLSADRNLVYADASIFIEHFCLKGVGDMTFLYTTAKHPSHQLINQIKKAVKARPEIQWSKFVKC